MTAEALGLEEFAPAKINLYLKVGAPRADGLHPLDSLAVFADIGDRLWVRPAKTLSLEITGPFSGALNANDENLVLRAARALSAAFGVPPEQGSAIMLEKNLPIASGIGGGSADAAACLRALRRLWKLPAETDLKPIARQLGADVPACLLGTPAIMRGAGDVLSKATTPNMGILLANNGEEIPTPAVYRRFDALERGRGFAETPPPSSANAAEFIAALGGVPNDLEAPAFELAPAIADLKNAVAALPDCRLARMSGSGGTVFGLFETRAAAEKASAAFRAANPGLWVLAGEVSAAR